MITSRKIPALESHHGPEHQQVIESRSYPFGRTAPLRLCKGLDVELTLRVNKALASTLQVTIFLSQAQGASIENRTLPCTRREPQTFVCTLRADQAGSFMFRARYSLDGGKSWLFDAVPFSWLLVEPPDADNLRLYSFIPTASGNMTQWKKYLPRIRDMGFNAIHILPLTALDRSQSPYSAYDLFSIDQSYADPSDSRDALTQWEDYVEAVKNCGLKLCVDLVLNHVGVTSRIAKIRPEWIVPDPARADGFKRAGCWHGQEWLSWEDLVLLNYEHPEDQQRRELWSYMVQYALFWANYAQHTGGLVRFDNLHSTSPDFMSHLSAALRDTWPDLILLAEFFSDEQTLVKRTSERQLDLLLATPWDYKFVGELRRYLKYLHNYTHQVRYLVPITSHDSGSPAQEFGSPYSTYPRYVVSALLGFGATGITQGVEWGCQSKVTFIGRNGSLPANTGLDFSDFLRRINAILERERVFRSSENCEFVDAEHPAVIGAVRWVPDAPGNCFLVAANFDIGTQQYAEFNLAPLAGDQCRFKAYDLLADGRPVGEYGARPGITLEPCGVRVLRLEKLPE